MSSPAPADTAPPELSPALAGREAVETVRALILAHRERMVAGVPGCSCGATYKRNTLRDLGVQHAEHLARLITVAAAVCALPHI